MRVLPDALLLPPLPGRPQHALDEARTGSDVRAYGCVVEDAELAQRPRRLEDRREPLLRTQMGRLPGHVPPPDAHAPLVGDMESRDAPEERRLAGAVRSDETGQRAFDDVESDVVHSSDGTEHLRDAGELARKRRSSVGLERSWNRPHRFRLP